MPDWPSGGAGSPSAGVNPTLIVGVVAAVVAAGALFVGRTRIASALSRVRAGGGSGRAAAESFTANATASLGDTYAQLTPALEG